jgi:hypothetical protein
MVSLLKYRAEADYGPGGERGVTGQEADCRYAPLPVVLAGGALLCFAADVVASQADWDRVFVFRFPTRHSFVDMLTRPDFQERHVHREAGLDRAIVLGTVPVGELPGQASTRRMLLEVWDGSTPACIADGQAVEFNVEGTIIGDGRTWTAARYTAIEPRVPLPLQLPRPDYQAMLLEPRIERW